MDIGCLNWKTEELAKLMDMGQTNLYNFVKQEPVLHRVSTGNNFGMLLFNA